MNDTPRRRRWITALIVLAVLGVIIGVVAWYNFFRVLPQPAWVNQDLKTHFMYASIGTEGKEGIPFWIFIILPKMFPDCSRKSARAINRSAACFTSRWSSTTRRSPR